LNQFIVTPNSNLIIVPTCKKLIIKGDLKRLSMTCPNCYKLINVEEEDLL